MSRYSMKELLIANASIALGVVMIATPFKHPPPPGQGIYQGAFPLIALLVGGMFFISTGMSVVLKNVWLGAAGALIVLFLIVAFFAMPSVHIFIR
jgi:hypothetical protein